MDAIISPVPKTPQTPFRLSEADRAIMKALGRKLGVENMTTVVKIAIRRMAEAEGIEVPEEPKPEEPKP